MPTNLSTGASSPGSEITVTNPTLEWTGSGATTYELAISNAPYGKNNTFYDVPLIPSSTTSWAVPSGVLQDGVSYAWNVQATNSAGQSPWSTPFYFTVNSGSGGPPQIPSGLSPGGGSSPGPTIATVTPTLTWNVSTGATAYSVAVENTSGKIVYGANVTTNTAPIPSGTLANGTAYLWTVSASNSAGSSSPASIEYFTINTGTAPVLSVTPTNPSVTPAAGSTNISVSNAGAGALSYSSTVTSGSAWLSIASGATGGNSGTIAVSCSANTGGQRSGTIQVTASGASGSPATVTVTQSGVTTSNIRISESQGFDILLAPSQSEMDAWMANSPYRDIGVYIGGCDASVAPPSGIKDGCGSVPAQVSARTKNTNLDSGWVSHVSSDGRGIMPLWVGPQSSCITQNPNGNNLIENAILTTASDLGAAEADAAANRASSLGMGNSIIYYDMEAYSTDNSTCSATVSQFLSGWVNELRAQGFQAGVYGWAYNAGDWTNSPDAIWAFYPDGVDAAADLASVLPGNWAQRRIHQYCAGGSSQICPSPAQEIWGSVTLGSSPNQGIDRDVEDGPVFSPSVQSSGSPDLVVQNISFSPASVAPGGSVAVNWTLKNQGTGTANASSTEVRITSSSSSYGSSANDVGAVPASSLSANGSVAQNVTVTAPSTAGTYYVWVIADNTGTAGQSSSAQVNDEAVASGTLTVR